MPVFACLVSKAFLRYLKYFFFTGSRVDVISHEGDVVSIGVCDRDLDVTDCLRGDDDKTDCGKSMELIIGVVCRLDLGLLADDCVRCGDCSSSSSSSSTGVFSKGGVLERSEIHILLLKPLSSRVPLPLPLVVPLPRLASLLTEIKCLNRYSTCINVY